MKDLADFDRDVKKSTPEEAAERRAQEAANAAAKEEERRREEVEKAKRRGQELGLLRKQVKEQAVIIQSLLTAPKVTIQRVTFEPSIPPPQSVLAHRLARRQMSVMFASDE